MRAISLLALVAATTAMAQRCPILLDGRIGWNMEIGMLDSGDGLCEREGVKGKGECGFFFIKKTLAI